MLNRGVEPLSRTAPLEVYPQRDHGVQTASLMGGKHLEMRREVQSR
jgi:hypothetical protein